jgi:hypothetical protein
MLYLSYKLVLFVWDSCCGIIDIHVLSAYFIIFAKLKETLEKTDGAIQRKRKLMGQSRERENW